MDETRASRFRFPQMLNEKSGPVGLPMDETLALFGPSGWGFYSGQYVAGMVASVLLYIGIRYFKKGRGSIWLYNCCYWYLPSTLFNNLYKVIPDSSWRLWLR
ncbi:type IV conjugative transfer system protein TraL [Klebsiella aerogenes]|uniref:type IV conjugative transfer system protein TraL n=1 Tax=Klebsiella aerogenes TaxID=548 RepID=UPI000DA1349A|nr:type IV conjugative transfer system protein TraL [Klebsiella aerogenes]HCB2859852.1 type IV conjugative transfer system protein TraL [Klebsiella aerogenes]HCB2864855.1 type IV conjugative transfer system protein TraL [Klebsiella aerogenes]HCB2880473.1 type IV conjugative transfer system protein TraL [Klebsiella aerogenes]HCB3345918.1 type IV conjugative transfer system protein TraL [Klebsiella aerogenes]HCM1811920.1 type IV conjugative transfer system protein TraL [Klebsiella aerogenes]